MSDAVNAMAHLVEIATTDCKDREYAPAVGHLMHAFDATDAKSTRTAMRMLDAALLKVKKGRAAQVLHLALGALVEAGAPPELGWPAAERGLKKTLDGASRFAQACVEAADELGVEEAVRNAGREVAKKTPKDAEAWEALKSRCLAAVACLSRSAKLRRHTRTSELVAAAYPLEDTIEQVTFLSHIMRILDDETFLVIHPASRRGFRVLVHEVSTNLELFVLLMDAIVGDPKKGMLQGPKPNPRAVAALTDPNFASKKTPMIQVSWNLVAWTNVAADGTLPGPFPETPQHWIWLESVPLDIPQFMGERVILIQNPIMDREAEVETSFSALSPAVRLQSKVGAAEVERLLLDMGKAAARAAAKAAKTTRSTKTSSRARA